MFEFSKVSISALAAGLAFAAPSPAQTTAAAPEASPSPSTGVPDIVVTAQRRTENLQRTAVAVSAVGAEQLRAANVSQPQDLSKLVPALKLSSAGGAGTQVTIRGVGNFAGNPYAEPAVAVNLDGIYLARSGGPDGLFYDLERVEVLKGPQGTLYGRNATAGAINIITRKPTDQWLVEGSVTAGNYDLWRGEGAVNAPLGRDVALRVAGQVTRRDGYLSDGYDDDKSESVRAQLRIKPADRLSILISGDYSHIGGQGPGSVIAPYLLPDHPYRGSSENGTNDILTGVSLGITAGANPNLLPKLKNDGFVDVKNRGVAATVDYDLGPAKLTILPSYRRATSDYLHYAAGFPITSHEDSDSRSVEARLASNNEASRLKWLLGGYFYDESLDFDLLAAQGVSFNRTIPHLRTRSYAAFGQLTYSLTDTLRLTGGARYTSEHKTQSGLNGGPPPAVPQGFSGPASAFYDVACAPYDATSGTCYAPLNGDLKKRKVTWKAGLEFDAAPRSLVYANVATGFKAGGFFGSLSPNTYKPETLTAYTIGTKNRFFDNKLQINGEAFYWSYKNKQITHIGPILPGGFNLITENAGSAHIYGAELELLFQPTRDDHLSADLQYLKSKYGDFHYRQTTVTGTPATSCATTPVIGQTEVAVDCSGRPLSQSPRWTLNLSYTHSFRFDSGAIVDAQVGSQIQSSYWVGEEYLPGEYQKISTVSNASLTWYAPSDRFTVGAFIDNIENRAVKSGSFAQPVIAQPFVILRAPRTFGARVGFNFH
jgi:iron complex outermembrane receptor protein